MRYALLYRRYKTVKLLMSCVLEHKINSTLGSDKEHILYANTIITISMPLIYPPHPQK